MITMIVLFLDFRKELKKMKTRFFFVLFLLFFVIGCNGLTTDLPTTSPVTTGGNTTGGQTTLAPTTIFPYTTTSPLTTTTATTTYLPTGLMTVFRIHENILQWRYSYETTWHDALDLSIFDSLLVREVIVNSAGELVVVYHDDTTANLGAVLNLHLVQFTDLYGNIISVQLVKTGEAAVAPYPKEHVGYEFTHWLSSFDNVTEDMIIIGAYAIKSFEISFDSQGGTQFSSQYYDHGVPVTLPTPIKAGYKFMGWFYGLDVNSPQLFNMTALTSDVTVYARWEKTTAITVYTEQELISALENHYYTEIYFGNDITSWNPLKVNRSVKIFGNNHQLLVKSFENVFYFYSDYDIMNYDLVFPSNGSLAISDLRINCDTGTTSLPVGVVFYLEEANKFNLTLENVDIFGNVEEIIGVFGSSEMKITVLNSRAESIYSFISSFYSNNIVFYADNLESTALTYIYQDSIVDSIFITKNSKINITDVDGQTMGVLTTYQGGDTDYVFDNTIIDFLTEEEAYIMAIRYSSSYHRVIFKDCDFHVFYPEFDKLFIDESGLSLYLTLEYNTFYIKEGVTEIPEEAFRSFFYYADFVLPSTLEAIGASAFRDSYGIASIIIPDGVTYIGDSAFYGCSSLASIYLPASLEYVGENAFKTIYYDGGNIYLEVGTDTSLWHADWSSIYNNHIDNALGYFDLDGVYYVVLDDQTVHITDFLYQGVSDIVIPDYFTIAELDYVVTQINPYAFAYNQSLLSVSLPASITVIAEGAFYENHNLRSVTFAANSAIADIGYEAFAYNYSLQGIIIPASVEVIGDYAFQYNMNLRYIIFEEGINLEYLPNGIFDYAMRLTEVTIPASVISIGDSAFNNTLSLKNVYFEENSQLVHIGSYAFNCAESIKVIDLPATVEVIEDYAFANMYKLETFNILGDSQLAYIGSYAFQNNEKLTGVSLPDSVTYLGSNVFNGCHSIKNFVLPLGVTEISNGLFYDAIGLETFIIQEGASITIIRSGAFAYTENLQEFVFPEDLQTIEGMAFYGTGLSSILIPSSVTSIGAYAFFGCDNLSEVILVYANSLTEIAGYAFGSCDNLKEFFIPNSVSNVHSFVFRYNQDLTVYVESGTDTTLWGSNWNFDVTTVINDVRVLTYQLRNGERNIVYYVQVGDSIPTPSDPVREGYEFKGWAIDVDGTLEPFDIETMPDQRLNVYAEWLLLE